MSRSNRTVIVGGGVAGFTTAEALREFGDERPITIVAAESRAPYNRPPLSKQVLTGEWEADDATIAAPDRIAELGIEFVTGVAATGIRPADHIIETANGPLEFETLVIASGVRSRQPAFERSLSGVHTLRTMTDAVAIRSDAAIAERVLVVGSGILGSEIAAGIRKVGAHVALVGRSQELRFGQVGALLSDSLIALHRAHDVDLRLGNEVVGLTGDERVVGAVLSDGSTVPADLVVVATGSLPNTEWLGAAVPVGDGVLCDADGRVASGIFAVGDVAAWATLDGTHERVEHQQSAIEQARHVASQIAGAAPEPPLAPFFWSELHGSRIQAYGRFGTQPLEIVAGDVQSARFVAASVRDGIPTGIVGWSLPRAFREARSSVDNAVPLNENERQLVS